MTQLVTPKLLARTKAVIAIALVVAVVQLIVGIAQVMILQRVQHVQDQTYSVLDSTVAAVYAGNPASAITRARIRAVCEHDLGVEGCPDAPDPGDVPPSTTSPVRRSQ